MKTVTAFIVLMFAVLIGFWTSDSSDNVCIQTRAAFDIGSGATKIKVAKVDTCSQRIIKFLMEKDVPVAYKQSLKLSANNSFSEAVIKEGIQALIDLKKEAAVYKPDGYFAVATSAFRTSKNGQLAVRQIESQIGIKIKIISQELEAKLGFAAVASRLGKKLNHVVVWDIGGGSMQITAYNGGGEFSVYEGHMASVSFKNDIIQNILKKDPTVVESPNPMGVAVAQAAVQRAGQIASSEVSEVLKARLHQASEVVGIGGVHFYSIRGQVKKDIYTANIINETLEKIANETDEQIGGEFFETQVSNLALVSGFMQGLAIDKVRAMKLNLADGLLIAPEWLGL